MLIDFRFENFRSYHREARLQLGSNGRISEVAAIFGPNASGKSNVVHALAMMRGIVLGSSSKNSTDMLPFQPFALVTNEHDSEGLFEVSFDIESRVYRYGFSFNQEAITAEWLFEYRHLAACFAGEECRVFVREGDSCNGQSTAAKELCAKTLPNMLLLAKLDQDNDAMAHSIFNWFRKLVIVRAYADDDLYSYSHANITRGPYRRQMMDLIRFADPTIASIREVPADWSSVEDLQQRNRMRQFAAEHRLSPAKIEFLRKSADDVKGLVPLPFDDFESAGTQKMFCLSGPLSDILANGYIFVIDEIDSKLHPILTQKLVSMFTDQSSNPHGAQLIVTTHDVELMRSGVLRISQIYFSEKNLRGESSLYALSNFRNADQYESRTVAEAYLRGIFGAVPSFDGDDFHELKDDGEAE